MLLRTIMPEDTPSVCAFAAQLFCSHEPLVSALAPDLTPPDVATLFSPVIQACCSSGLSFLLVVEDAQQHQQPAAIVALSLALPYTQYKAIEWPLVPAARPAAAIMESLPQQLPPGVDKAGAVYCFFWGTHADHMGRGCMKRVLDATMQAAEQAGCSSLVADLTNVVSQHLALSRFGFQALQPCARYRDHEAFRGVQGTEAVVRAVKVLTPSCSMPGEAAADGSEPAAQQQPG